MTNGVELKIEHILIFIIVVFLLYYLINRCQCTNRVVNGFSVGMQQFDEFDTCIGFESLDKGPHKCAYQCELDEKNGYVLNGYVLGSNIEDEKPPHTDYYYQCLYRASQKDCVYYLPDISGSASWKICKPYKDFFNSKILYKYKEDDKYGNTLEKVESTSTSIYSKSTLMQFIISWYYSPIPGGSTNARLYYRDIQKNKRSINITIGPGSKGDYYIGFALVIPRMTPKSNKNTFKNNPDFILTEFQKFLKILDISSTFVDFMDRLISEGFFTEHEFDIEAVSEEVL